MSAGAELRMADALLRACGGRKVLLRVATPAIAGEDTEQLGLEIPQFQDVELWPVVFRRSSSSPPATELLVSATAIKNIVGTFAYDSVTLLFRDALGIVIDDNLFAIERVQSSQIPGVVYLYQLQLRML